jgi:hypothetical protein
MTTGRINQVTIVSRERPPAPLRVLESFPSYWWHSLECAGRGGRALGPGHRAQHLLSHSTFPSALSTAQRPGGLSAVSAPREEDHTLQRLPWRCQLQAIPSERLLGRLARGQQSKESTQRSCRSSRVAQPPTIPPSCRGKGRNRGRAAQP